MTNPAESALCQSVIVLIQLNKVFSKAIAQLKQDVGALRETVKGLDPTFSETYAHRQKQEAERLSELTSTIAELSQTLDELLKQLQDMQTHLAH